MSGPLTLASRKKDAQLAFSAVWENLEQVMQSVEGLRIEPLVEVVDLRVRKLQSVIEVDLQKRT